MPSGQPPGGERALSNAERQARHRARRQAQQTKPMIRYRKPADRRTRPQRWRDAVAELLVLQTEYEAWAEALPEALRGTATADALQAIIDIDLSELASIKPPRGYGRD